MEPDRFKELFAGYNPGLTDSAKFLSRLERNLDVVDELKSRVGMQRRGLRTALIAASVAGWACGAMSVLAFPSIKKIAAAFLSSFPSVPSVSADLAVWTIIAAVTVGASALAFTLTRSILFARFAKFS